MSENVCLKCGRDCRTKLALSKHENKCSGSSFEIEGEIYELSFSNRHETSRLKIPEKCPVCSEFFIDFWIKDPSTWVCLGCGCHFTPKSILSEIYAEKIRIANRIRR